MWCKVGPVRTPSVLASRWLPGTEKRGEGRLIFAVEMPGKSALVVGCVFLVGQGGRLGQAGKWKSRVVGLLAGIPGAWQCGRGMRRWGAVVVCPWKVGLVSVKVGVRV